MIIREKATNIVTHLIAPAPQSYEFRDGGFYCDTFGFLPNMPESDFEVVASYPQLNELFLGRHFTFDGSWAVIDQAAYDLAVVPLLEEQKKLVRQAIEEKWASIFYASIPHGGTGIQFRGEKDMTRLVPLQIAAAAQVADGNPTATVSVIMEDNSIADIESATFLGLWTAGVSRNSQASINARSLKNDVDAAATYAALNAIDVNAGWP